MKRGAKKAGKRPTLKDVAQLAGVSPMTASRVVGGKGGVSPEFTKQVQRAVKELGYSRNEAARLMRPGQRSGLLGVIITSIDNPYYAQVLLGIETAAQRAGRLIITGISRNDPALEARLVSDLLARQIEGLIVVPASGDAPHLLRVASKGIPITLASRSISQGGVDTVLVDDVGAVRDAVQGLLKQRRHPIAFIGGPEAITTAERRYEGFVDAHVAVGSDVRSDLVVRMPPDPEEVAAAVRRLLDLDEPPRAFFTTNNRYSISVLRVLLQSRDRWQDPSDMPPLVGFDTFEFSDLVPYPLTLIEHDAQALGRIAAELTIRQAASDEKSPPTVTTLPCVILAAGADH